MKVPQLVEVKGIRVLTTNQLADMYDSTEVRIRQNYQANKRKYVDGKHFISLTGDELKKFKKQVGNSYVLSNMVSHLYLWTEKGALLHAKSLNTDKAWEVYDYLVDFYFRAKDEKPVIEDKVKVPIRMVADIPENAQIQKAIVSAKKYLTAIDVALDSYNQYLSDESLQNMSKTINRLSEESLRKVSDVLLLKPKFISKYM